MRSATIAASLLAICFAIYSSTINGYFLADDFGYVQLYYRQNLSALATILAADWSQGIWGAGTQEMRSVIALSYIWDSWLWGVNPFGYHFTNALIHALNALLVYLIAKELARIKPAGALAAALFALHPAHAEAVSWIAGRTDVISTFFYLSGLLAFGFYRMRGQARYWLVSLALYLLGLFSKEVVISFPLAALAYDFFYGRRGTVRSRTQWWAPHLTNLALLAGYLWLRQRAFGSSLGVGYMQLKPMLAEMCQRQIFYLSSLFPLGSLLFERLSKVWVLILASLLTLALGLGFIHRGFRRQAVSALADLYMPVIYFGLIWYLITMAPLARSGYISSRHIYLASAGACVATGCMLIRLAPKPIFIIASLLLAAAYGHWLHQANKPWRRAGQLSARMHGEIHSLLKDAPAGEGLIFSLPGHIDKAWVWEWASPFVFRQPFSPAQLDERYQILESPAIYCCDWARHRLPLARQLLERPVDSHLFFIGVDGHMVKKKIPQERLRTRLSEILAGADWNSAWMAEATAASP